MTSFLCEAFEANGTIERYVAGSLDDRHAAEFENHYLTCVRCQDSVRAGVGVRGAHVPALAKRPAAWRMTAVLAAAAALAIFMAVRGYHYGSVRNYGSVDAAPLYVGSAVRSDDASATFDSAMAAYTRADYRHSADLLRRLDTGAATTPVVLFFLGASDLMQRDAKAAEAEFTRVLQLGNTIYQPESYFYRAKARLQQGNREGAVSDLQAAAHSDNPIAQDARTLLTKLEH